METLTMAAVIQYGSSIVVTSILWRLIPRRWRQWADRLFVLVVISIQLWDAATYRSFPMPTPPLFHTP